MKKEILKGFLTAIVATIFGFVLYLELFSKYDIVSSLNFIKKGDLFGKVLSIAAIANLFVFFIFLKKKQDYRARGALLATFLIAFIILILRIF